MRVLFEDAATTQGRSQCRLLRCLLRSSRAALRGEPRPTQRPVASSSASVRGLLTYFVQPGGSGNGQSQIIDPLRAQDLHPSRATVNKVEHRRPRATLVPSLVALTAGRLSGRKVVERGQNPRGVSGDFCASWMRFSKKVPSKSLIA